MARQFISEIATFVRVYEAGPYPSMQSPRAGKQEIINRHHFALDLDRVDFGVKIRFSSHDIASIPLHRHRVVYRDILDPAGMAPVRQDCLHIS